MNGYEKSVELSLPGTDAEKVAVLQTLTVHDIPVESVRTWFRENELWLERSTGEMFGPLQTAYEQAPQDAKDGLDYLYDAVFAKSAKYLRTTEPVWAQKAYNLVELILQLSPGSSGLVDSFYALDGGRPYKTLTVEQFAAQRAAAETEAANTAKRNQLTASFHAYLNAIGTSEQSDRKAELLAELEAS